MAAIMNLEFITDDAFDDPVIPHFEKACGAACPVRRTRLSEMLKRHGFHVSRDGELKRRDPAATGKRAATEEWRIIDRVIEISGETIRNLGDSNGMLTRGIVSYAYQTLLCDFMGMESRRSSYSTVGNLVPLFTQWRIVRETIPSVEVPDFLYGYGPEKIDISGMRDPLFKSPFDIYNWRQSDPPGEGAFDVFVVDKPVGRPVLSYFLFGEIHVHDLHDPASDLESGLGSRIRNATCRIAPAFRGDMGEMLWFANGRSLVFAAYSHVLNAASRLPSIDAAVHHVVDSGPGFEVERRS